MKKVEVESIIVSDQFYPNPTLQNSFLRLDGEEEILQKSVVITELSGRQVHPNAINVDQKTINLDLGNLASGVYLVNYETSLQKYTSKIIKN